MRTVSPLQLGASLYMPATRADLAAHANGEKLPFLRSMIFCTEDAVRLDQLEGALQDLESLGEEVHADRGLVVVVEHAVAEPEE